MGREETVKVTEWHNVPRVELGGLSPESYYRAEIEAYNDIGYSEKVALVFRTARGEERISRRCPHSLHWSVCC